MTGDISALTVVGRPLAHFSPRHNWMNDPNGLVHHEGRYHLFFQYGPSGTHHADISWGHASSDDLLHWEEHEIAIPSDDDEEIFSGSIVVDEKNTAGFAGEGETALVAIYTSHRRHEPLQTQALAYSVDGGETWTKYAGNPVLDRGSANFRDPKVFRWNRGDRGYWVMAAVEAEFRQVVFYASEDLKSWWWISSFGPAGAVGGVWECPDLFPLPVDGHFSDMRWVLLVSMYPGAPAGGSGTQYFVGSFDGTTFTADDDLIRWIDLGRDCYAGVTFHGLPDDERTFIAWMSNWDYARETPELPSRGAMTIPRRLELVRTDNGVMLAQTPVLPDLEETADYRDVAITAPWTLPTPLPTAGVLRLSLCGVPDAGFAVRLRHRPDGSGGVLVTVRDGIVSVDRTAAADPHPELASIESAKVPSDASNLTIVWDVISVEVFVGETVVLTGLAFTAPIDRGCTILSPSPFVIERLSIAGLRGGTG